MCGMLSIPNIKAAYEELQQIILLISYCFVDLKISEKAILVLPDASVIGIRLEVLNETALLDLGQVRSGSIMLC